MDGIDDTDLREKKRDTGRERGEREEAKRKRVRKEDLLVVIVRWGLG